MKKIFHLYTHHIDLSFLLKLFNYLFKNIVCYVLIESIKKIKTKKNEDMAFISGSDETGVSDFTVFPNKFYLINDVEVNNVVKVWCTVTKRYDKLSLVINNIIKE